jgi:hypothetical protein
MVVLMERTKCYIAQYFDRCLAEKGHWVSVAPSDDKGRRIGVYPPPRCVPDDYNEAKEFYAKLRNESCVSLLAVDGKTNEILGAISSGAWQKKDLLLKIDTFDKDSVKRVYDEIDEYVRNAYGEDGVKQKLRGIWMDEPQDMPYLNWDPIACEELHDFINEIGEKFVCSDYVGHPWGIRKDWREIMMQYFDEVMDDGYHHDRYEWISFPMKGAWINVLEMNDIAQEIYDYLGWAGQAGMGEIWFYGGNYSNCKVFWDDLISFCTYAAKYGWAKPIKKWIIDEYYYCQHQDCRECDNYRNHPENYPLHWGKTSLGPICEEKLVKDYTYYDPFIINRNDKIYKMELSHRRCCYVANETR